MTILQRGVSINKNIKIVITQFDEQSLESDTNKIQRNKRSLLWFDTPSLFKNQTKKQFALLFYFSPSLLSSDVSLNTNLSFSSLASSHGCTLTKKTNYFPFTNSRQPTNNSKLLTSFLLFLLSPTAQTNCQPLLLFNTASYSQNGRPHVSRMGPRGSHRPAGA